jgi:hypothetical protein
MRYNGCKVGGCEKCISLKFGENIWLNKLFSLPISAKLKLKDARFIVKEFVKILEKIK